LDEAIAIAQRGSLAFGAAIVVVIAVAAGCRYLREAPRRGRSATRVGLKVRSEDSS
jgi:hypothetical protein